LPCAGPVVRRRRSDEYGSAGTLRGVEEAALRPGSASRRLNPCRAALEAGSDPALVTRWTADVNAERIDARSRLRRSTGRTRMTTTINALVTGLGRLADPVDKAAVYQRLGLTMSYEHETHRLQARPWTTPGRDRCGSQ
jgi:hypothetical protein